MKILSVLPVARRLYLCFDDTPNFTHTSAKLILYNFISYDTSDQLRENGPQEIGYFSLTFLLTCALQLFVVLCNDVVKF